jgi:Fur family ferric uptake transcriptional regulator
MDDDFETALRSAGLKVTAGRVAVLEQLDELPHADAEQVFKAVSRSLSTTSIQSVHNILADLSNAKLVRRIEPAGSTARYERRVGDNHHHVVCTHCGAVSDVDCVVGEPPCLTPSSSSGYTIHTAEVTFWGLCPSCQ